MLIQYATIKVVSFIITIIITTTALSIEPIRNKAIDIFFNWVSYQMDKEEAEREEKYKRHEVVNGKDTACIWNKHYEIWNQSGDKRFGIETAETDCVIFLKVQAYDAYKDQFYVVAEEGYAVVDRENHCRMFLLQDIEIEESKYFEYLSSYEDFSERERKHLEKMIRKLK